MSSGEVRGRSTATHELLYCIQDAAGESPAHADEPALTDVPEPAIYFGGPGPRGHGDDHLDAFTALAFPPHRIGWGDEPNGVHL